jgi:hypothetical protein
MMIFPRSAAGRVTLGLAAVAFCVGLYGLLNPAAQLQMMQLGPGVAPPGVDGTSTLLVIANLAAINTAAIYLLGSIKEWSEFFVLAIGARLFMGIGFAVLNVQGVAPNTFIAAAAWEWFGASLITTAYAWDVRKRRDQSMLQ